MSGIPMRQKNSPKVSIVTVTYNAKAYLEQTLESVIEQDYPNIEYIIIDGASTDGTINIIKQYETEKIFEMPVVTEITPFKAFYPAENYHHDYFEQNKRQPYCQFVISPKIEKFKEKYKDRLKNNNNF